MRRRVTTRGRRRRSAFASTVIRQRIGDNDGGGKMHRPPVYLRVAGRPVAAAGAGQVRRTDCTVRNESETTCRIVTKSAGGQAPDADAFSSRTC